MKEQTQARLDPLSPTERSELMSRVRGKDTKPELLVRRLVWSLGYRYRLHSRKLPGRPDIVLSKRKKAIFVHGCFWHQHPGCARAKLPQTRAEWWRTKLTNNRKRDKKVQKQLREQGWEVLIVWQCRLRETSKLKAELIRFLTPKANIGQDKN
jgi:DNA mismatch endonuclease (patch repair protein)